jgi:hypothetical protein
MFMRRPSYLDEDSGSQAIAGESSRILKQSWSNPKIVSQTVSHWPSHFPNSLLHTQLELEARHLSWSVKFFLNSYALDGADWKAMMRA